MSLNPAQPILSRKSWIAYAIVELVLFVTANITAKNSGHPGTTSQIFFITFVAGLVIAVVLSVATLVRRRRAIR